MNCDELREQGLLEAYALGNAIPRVAELHLESCEHCLPALDNLRSTLAFIDKQLRATGSPNVPEGLVERIATEAGKDKERRIWTHRLLWGAAAASVLLAASLGVFRGQTPEASNERDTVAGSTPVPTNRPPNTTNENWPGAPSDEDPNPVQPLAKLGAVDRPPAEAEPARLVASPSPSAVPPPSVLVPPGQEDAIFQFYENWRKGRIASLPPGIGERAPAPMRELMVRPLYVEPIVFEPISFADLSLKWSGE